MAEYQPNETYIDQLENELALERNRNTQLTNSQMGMFNSVPSEDNLIRWQLDLKEDIDKIYHLLRGDVVVEDEEGNIKYEESDDDNLKPFNEFGTQMIMNIMSFYLNRNTLLSNYDEETINWKVEDFGKEISDLILCKYRDMMLTTSFEKEFEKEFGIPCERLPNNNYVVKVEEGNEYQYMMVGKDVSEEIKSKIEEHMHHKVEMYPMIILELTDCIHSALLRALDGGERESLRTARTIHQNETIGGNQNNNSQNNLSKHRVWYRPSTWI